MAWSNRKVRCKRSCDTDTGKTASLLKVFPAYVGPVSEAQFQPLVFKTNLITSINDQGRIAGIPCRSQGHQSGV